MPDNLEPCDIRIDKEGIWYFRGEEMFRRDIVNFFYENLKLDITGRYLIELPGEGGDRCYIDVEDTPFIVRAVHEIEPGTEGKKGFIISLSDDSKEELDAATLRVGRDNVLYCTVKDGNFDARFSRAGYYQLANHIEYDADQDAYFIDINDQHYEIVNQINVIN